MHDDWDDDEWRQKTQEEAQNFEALEFDATLANMIANDIDGRTPEHYENIRIWGQLIAEAAGTIVEEVSTNSLWTYIDSAIVQNLPEQSQHRSVAKLFVQTIFDSAIVDSSGIRINTEGGGFYTKDSSHWTVNAEVVGKFAARKFEHEDLKEETQVLVHDILQNAHTITASQAETSLNRLMAIKARDMHLTGDMYTDSRGNTYAPDRASIRSHFIQHSDMHIDPVTRMLENKLVFDRTVSHAVEAVNFDRESARLTVGSKAANLLHMQKVLDSLHESNPDDTDFIRIPPFTTVPVSSYETWLVSDKIDAAQDIAVWIEELDPNSHYVVRSSAVHSEDSEHMGAGTYDSVLLPPQSSLSDIEKAVQQVYHSTLNDAAVIYQQSIGVEHEQMGLVVQQIDNSTIENWGHTTLATVNTCMNQVPQLGEYTVMTGRHPLSTHSEDDDDLWVSYLPFSRSGMALEFGSKESAESVTAPRFHVPPDTRIHNPHATWLITQAATLAERIIGQPVQVELECMNEARLELRNYTHNPEKPYVNLLQARPLPPNWLTPKEFVGFPEDKGEPWFAGKAVGVMNDIKASVSRSQSGFYDLEFTDGNVLFVYNSSYAQSGGLYELKKRLAQLSDEDRSRVFVLVQSPPDHRNEFSGYGHFETLFAEAGVGLIFYSGFGRSGGSLVTDQQVEIYANGYEGKIYAKDDDPAIAQHEKFLRGDLDDEFDRFFDELED